MHRVAKASGARRGETRGSEFVWTFSGISHPKSRGYRTSIVHQDSAYVVPPSGRLFPANLKRARCRFPDDIGAPRYSVVKKPDS